LCPAASAALADDIVTAAEEPGVGIGWRLDRFAEKLPEL